MQVNINKDLKVELYIMYLKIQLIELQLMILKQNYENALAEFCKANSKETKDIESMNLETGIVIFKDSGEKKDGN